MQFRVRSARGSAALALVALSAALAGCQSGTKPAAEAAEPKVTQRELEAYCPPVALREGTTVFSVSGAAAASDAEGGEAAGSAGQIVHQASISDATRTCSREGGTLTMKVAVAGRVVPGPLAKPGTVTMPIRVAVTRGGEVLYSELRQHRVEVGSTTEATQFLFTDEGVSFPEGLARGARVYAGFDEGPLKATAAAGDD